MLSDFVVFWFGHFSRSGFESESRFLIKCYIITVLIFFVDRFVKKNGVSKNGFPVVFTKSDLAGGGGTLNLPKKIRKSQTPWNMPKF